jgi:tRNA (mo5U34)-methyltransferase
MNQTLIRRRIADFNRWHYEFDLQGEKTPIFDEGHRNRHRERRRYFFDALVRACGGTLRGRSVLDLGCNAGFWALCAIEAGCDFVLGIDGRRMHIEQSEFVFEAKGVDRSRYRFVEADVFDYRYADERPFDVVLCLGLLYHVNRPIDLLQTAAGANTDLLVIDTTVSKERGASFELKFDNTDDPRDALRTSAVLWPTVGAVTEMMRHLGYHGVTLKPAFADYFGAQDYLNGARRAFVCAKRTDLSCLTPIAEQQF